MKEKTATDCFTIAAPGRNSESLVRDFCIYFTHTLGRDSYHQPPHYEFIALAMTLRDRLMAGSNNTRHQYEQLDSRRGIPARTQPAQRDPEPGPRYRTRRGSQPAWTR